MLDNKILAGYREVTSIVISEEELRCEETDIYICREWHVKLTAFNTQDAPKCRVLLIQPIIRIVVLESTVVLKDEIIHSALSNSANPDRSSSPKRRL